MNEIKSSEFQACLHCSSSLSFLTYPSISFCTFAAISMPFLIGMITAFLRWVLRVTWAAWRSESKMEKAVFYSICLYYYRSVAGYKKMGWKNGVGNGQQKYTHFYVCKAHCYLQSTYLLPSNSFPPFRSDI